MLVAGCGKPKVEDSLVKEREALDAGLCSPERTAQAYETRIVSLWDELLLADDKFAVLAQQSFYRFHPGQQRDDGKLQNGIRVRRFVPSEEV